MSATPAELWREWTADPLVLAGTATAAWLYARGLRAVSRRAGPRRGLSRWRVGAFVGGLVAVVAALVSPVDALAGELFSAHMLQHLLLVSVAAPLLALGRPLLPCLWALPRPTCRALARSWAEARPLQAVWHGATQPFAAWALQTLALWLWHTPPLYQAALADDVVHATEHACFLGTGVLFWWALLESTRTGRLPYLAAAAYVFLAGLQGSALGALLTFSAAPWYPAYAASAASWGLTPLEDQQLAGLLMWVPSGAIYTLAALAFCAAALSPKSEARSVERVPLLTPGVGRQARATGREH